MKIAEALKNKEVYDIRVVYGDRWLYWDEHWIVREHKYHQKQSTLVTVTGDEDKAVEQLLKG